jgi:hypothetical protein
MRFTIVPEKRYLSFRQISLAIFSVVNLESSFDIVIREFSLWVHSCQEVEVISHEAKAQYLCKID